MDYTEVYQPPFKLSGVLIHLSLTVKLFYYEIIHLSVAAIFIQHQFPGPGIHGYRYGKTCPRNVSGDPLSDRQEWIRFIKENYTQALINKQQTMKVVSSENGNTATSEEKVKEADKLEAKANMFARLHEDFSGSTIVSIKLKEENLEMVLNNGDGLTGTFKLRFDKNKPYLIDAIGIEAGN